jgi:N-acetylmuramoyl-L-alanine amidase
MKIFINPGHMPGVDSGAVNDKYGVTEAGIVKEIGGGSPAVPEPGGL